MGFPLHIRTMVGPGVLFWELIVGKANTDLSRWPELDLLCWFFLQGWQ